MNMFARDRAASRSLPIFALALIAWLAPATAIRGGETVTIGNLTFVNQALVGVGRLPANLRDKFGETFGSGSAIAVDPKSWVRTPTGYQGTFYMLPDRGFFFGDEYGPYVYRFSPAGRLLAAIRPPEAFLPKRKGKDHFASNNPGPGGRAPEPPEPETGRANNQGFEGLTLTPPGGK